jgi:hypothetical protein
MTKKLHMTYSITAGRTIRMNRPKTTTPLTIKQVRRGIERKPTLAELLDEGASIVAGCKDVERHTRLYPIGTAMALAHIFNAMLQGGTI